ncbi:MAG: ribonuclease P protein component [Pedobacter sp.]|nr:ribonuclease P protein component [Chitinophagaceae bacterium]
MPTFTFNKQEKLKSRKLIQQLFAEGKSFLVFPVKVMYLQVAEPMDFPLKVGVSASSRSFKKAVDRNKIKRVLREQYRLNKLPLHNFVTENNQHTAVFFLYIGKALPEKGLIEKKMPIIIQKLITTFNETIVATT